MIDLHVHSTFSDGTLTPSQIITKAIQTGLHSFALTDHDNTDGISEALSAARHTPIEIVSGIELSTTYLNTDVHIIGLDVNWKEDSFQKKIKEFQDTRMARSMKMIELMQRDGIDISYDKMCLEFGDAVWTRAHFARYLYLHNYVESPSAAFETHIGEHCRYYVDRQRISPFEAVKFILQYDGIPILAHPFQYKFSEHVLLRFLEELKTAGLIGMEVYYSGYSSAQTAELLAYCQHYHLSPSGGSDFHGQNKPAISLGTGTGNLNIPDSILSHLRKRKMEAFNHDI